MYGFLPSVSIECCKNKIDQLYASVMPGDNQWKMAGFMGVQVNAIRFFSSNLAASLLATPPSPLLDIFGHFNCWLELGRTHHWGNQVQVFLADWEGGLVRRGGSSRFLNLCKFTNIFVCQFHSEVLHVLHTREGNIWSILSPKVDLICSLRRSFWGKTGTRNVHKDLKSDS